MTMLLENKLGTALAISDSLQQIAEMDQKQPNAIPASLFAFPKNADKSKRFDDSDMPPVHVPPTSGKPSGKHKRPKSRAREGRGDRRT